MELEVVDWISWDEATARMDAPEWHNPRQAEEDLEIYDIMWEEALLKALRAFPKGQRFGGFAHQSPEYKAVPVFSDGNIAMLGMRSWGGYCAEAWGFEDSMDYVHFAWEYMIDVDTFEHRRDS